LNSFYSAEPVTHKGDLSFTAWLRTI